MTQQKTSPRCSAVIDAIPSGLCVIDRGLRVHRWNQTLAIWTGIAAEQIVGKLLTDHFSGVDTPRYRRRIDAAFEQGMPVVFSAAIHRQFLPAATSTGKPTPAYQEARLQPLADQPDQAVLVIDDVTAQFRQTEELRIERRSLRVAVEELKLKAEALNEARQQADAASLAKSEFLANMSHEIRTPMTAILGFAEVLEDHELDEAERRRSVATIRENGHHLLQLINDILDISKVEAGRLELDQTDCAIRQMVHGLQQTFQTRAQDRGIVYRCEIDPHVPNSIVTDPLRMKQVLINLLGNAVKFTDSGEVSLTVQWLTDRGDVPVLQFDVRDTGIGMSDAQVSRLFQPFSQVDASATRRFSGTGLGLAISRSVVEMLGGDITVTSEPGQGSCFSVTLPIETWSRQDGGTDDESSDQTAAETVSKETRPKRPLEGIRVLLADDGLDNQKLISFRLRRDGTEPTVVGNGQQAVDAITAADDAGQGFDVVLMDMQMPVMDGYTATTELRRRGYNGPIIALTANAMASDRQTCLDAGCTDYSTKPINWTELRQLIQQYAQVAEAAVV